MMRKPLIGLVPLWDEQKDSYWMLPGYMDGVSRAGGLPIILPLTGDPAEIEQLTALCNGFLLTGGHDVSPSMYGECAVPECGATCFERDSMESILLRQVLKLDKPVLGICRGIQFLNVALGGTLYQDLPTQHHSSVIHRQKPPYGEPSHTVTVMPETPLKELLGKEQLAVNSCHHQGIRDLANDLRPMAVAEDGLVEAVYLPSACFVWAVQWHPEFFPAEDWASNLIFKAFVEECK